MTILSSDTYQDYPQRDGKRRVLHVFRHHVVGDVQRRRILNPEDDAAADRALLEPIIDQQVFDSDAETEAHRQKEVPTDGTWSSGAVADSKAVAARLVELGAQEEDSFRAWKILKKVVPWILSQGWTVAQIATYLGVTEQTVINTNARWIALSSEESTFSPLIDSISIEDKATVITADPGVIDWQEQ